MSTRNFFIALFMSVVGLSGCALTTEKIELHYNQQQGVSKIPGADNVSINVKVTDERQDKSKVSSKKNGYGMEMAPIIAIEDVTVTVRKAIEQELQTRGFQLGSENAIILVAADLTRFYNDYKMGFFAGDAIAEINLSINVKSQTGSLLYSRIVHAQGIEKNTQLASGENARLALNRALENGMKSLFEDSTFLSALMSVSESKTSSK